MNINICEKRKRILDEDGHILVIGGPGSGKTTIALKKALVKIEKGIKNGQAILFVSFSRAAISRLIDSASEIDSTQLLKNVSIQTFHSFCFQIIKSFGYLLGSPRKIKILLPAAEKVLNAGITEHNSEWNEWLKARENLFFTKGNLAFDLFAPKVLQILNRSQLITKIICNKYPLIIIDEAQDTDTYQWETIIKLSSCSQILCLADLEQQIYDFRPGVSIERVEDILNVLHPLRIDLEMENYRSSEVDILEFGNDVLINKPKSKIYKGILKIDYFPKAKLRDRTIRQAIGRISNQIKDSTGEFPKSIGFFASWNKGVAIISNALRGNDFNQEISHQILFDETGAILSSKIVAFLLEPKMKEKELENLNIILSLISDLYISTGSKNNIVYANTLSEIARKCLNDQYPRKTKLINNIISLFNNLDYEGIPRKDWMKVRNYLKASNDKTLLNIEYNVQYLVAFNRGKKISDGLSNTWKDNGNYKDAREIVSSAINEEQLLSDTNQNSGIQLMTLHKSKGKQFDGVIILDESRICPYLFCKENSPYNKSRKLLRVGITRAKHFVILLTDSANPTPLLKGF